MKYLHQSIAGLAVLGLFQGCEKKADLSSPNVILIFMDDMGYGDLTCFGAGLMAGCYPNRIGLVSAISNTARHGINENEMTMAGTIFVQCLKIQSL